jgi:hypothetical protein
MSKYGINDLRGTFEVKEFKTCPIAAAYADWSSMRVRVFSTISHKKCPNYAKVTCCPEWEYFSEFLKWFQESPLTPVQKMNLCLDKDIRGLWSQHYSPDTCLYVTQEINNLFLVGKREERNYMFGVTYDKSSNKYRAQGKCVQKGVQMPLGRFKTELEAHHAFLVNRAALYYWAAQSYDEVYEEALTKAADLLMSVVESGKQFDFGQKD